MCKRTQSITVPYDIHVLLLLVTEYSKTIEDEVSHVHQLDQSMFTDVRQNNTVQQYDSVINCCGSMCICLSKTSHVRYLIHLLSIWYHVVNVSWLTDIWQSSGELVHGLWLIGFDEYEYNFVGQ